MALKGIGGENAGSALDRFQAIRDLAKKKLDGADGQANLAELIKRKQAELGAGGIAARSPAERILPGPGTAGATAKPASGNPAALAGPVGYGQSGGARKQSAGPTLGRHVDFMA